MKTIISVLAIIGLSLWIFHLAISINDPFRSWQKKCSTDGGMTVMTDRKIFSSHWECLKDGKIINHQ